jgi:hypothetical protein
MPSAITTRPVDGKRLIFSPVPCVPSTCISSASSCNTCESLSGSATTHVDESCAAVAVAVCCGPADGTGTCVRGELAAVKTALAQESGHHEKIMSEMSPPWLRLPSRLCKTRLSVFLPTCCGYPVGRTLPLCTPGRVYRQRFAWTGVFKSAPGYAVPMPHEPERAPAPAQSQAARPVPAPPPPPPHPSALPPSPR